MIKIELFDGTVLEFPEGTSDDVIDRVARQETLARQPQQDQQPESAFGGFMGNARDLAASVGSGLARGVTGVIDFPAMVMQLGQAGAVRAYKAITGEDPPEEFVRELTPTLPVNLDMSRPYASEAANAVAPSVMQFEPETRLGKFAQTGAEFATGAGMVGGARAAVRHGLLPGLASEAAGQATEGTAAEPYARTAAAVGTSFLATPRPTGVGARVSRADPERASSSQSLMRAGVKPTAGQTVDSEALMRAEGALGPRPEQLDAFTKAALRTAGNTIAKRATPDVLRSTQKKITDGMNDILDVDVPVTPSVGQRAMNVADDFFETTAGKALPVNLRKVSEQFQDFATAPGPVNSVIPAKTLRQWRSKLGTYTTSSDEATREAAHALREVIDDMTEETLRKLGRSGDIAVLAALRTQYRNFLTIADATTRGGREGASGLLTPERVSSAAKRVMGRTNYATGRATDLATLARQGEMVIGAAPTVKPGGLRDVATGAGLTGAGGLAGFMGGGPAGALAGATAGAVAPSVGAAAMRSGPVQSAIMQPSQFGGSVATLPGILQYDFSR